MNCSQSAAPQESGLAPADISNWKGVLQQRMHEILKRPIIRGDIEYTCDLTSDGWGATVQLRALADLQHADAEIFQKVGRFEGEAHSRKTDAEQSAAKAAV